MRIGVLADKLHPGSTPRIIGGEVRYLRELGQDASAVVIMDGLPGANQYQDYFDGLPVRFLSKEFGPVFNELNFKFPYFAFFSSSHVMAPYFSSRSIRSREYDVIISHWVYTTLTARRLWEKREIPYFAFMWDPTNYIIRKCYSDSGLRSFFPILLPMSSSLDRYVMEESVAVIASCNFHMKYLRSRTSKQIEIAYPGCDPVDKLPQERGDYILAVDRWDVGNVPNKLLGMMKLLPKHAKLLIVGFWYPPRLRESFENDVKKMGLVDQVKVMGPVDRATIKKLYAGARLLVHPNEEAIGFVSHEASACGCPIIMPGTSGNAELYKHGVDAFFPQKFDAEEYANYAAQLIADERLAWRMGRNAWQIAKNYTWKDHTIQINEIVKKHM